MFPWQQSPLVLLLVKPLGTSVDKEHGREKRTSSEEEVLFVVVRIYTMLKIHKKPAPSLREVHVPPITMEIA
ncbi:MAG: hypothetical protein AAB911_02395 [Patescibacteria group bacterium]